MQQIISTTRNFFYFPKAQNICLIYADVSVLKLRLFKSLCIQVSSKNTLLFRFRKQKLGHLFYKLVYRNEPKLQLECSNATKLGYLSNGKKIVFEFDEQNEPIYVYKQGNVDGNWEKEHFLGYTLIENYSKEEYFNKRKLLKKALEIRWNQITKGEKLHGDFTHLNVLISSSNELIFIDEKQLKNSQLFDHYYFYSYFIQCLEKCETINNNDVAFIKEDIQQLIKGIFLKCTKESILEALNSINLEHTYGIDSNNKKQSLINFKNFILN